MPRYAFTYPSTRKSADRVLDDLGSVLADCAVEEDLIHALSVAVSEAFTNAVIHGNRENQSKNVKIRVQVNDSEVTADIIDQGTGGVKQIESRKPSDELDEGGRGIDLIRHYADLCCFTEVDSGGLKVSVVFHRTKEMIV